MSSLLGLFNFEKKRVWFFVDYEIFFFNLSKVCWLIGFYPELKLKALYCIRWNKNCWKWSDYKSWLTFHLPTYTLFYCWHNNNWWWYAQDKFFCCVFCFFLLLWFLKTKYEMCIILTFNFNQPVNIILITYIFLYLNICNDLLISFCIIFWEYNLFIFSVCRFYWYCTTD